MKNNNNANLDFTSFDNIKFDLTGKKTAQATKAALEAIKAEADNTKKWTMIRELAIALSCSVATIVAWLWPNKKAIHKEIRRYDAGEFLWQDEFYSTMQMMTLGLYTKYSEKCSIIVAKKKELADAIEAKAEEADLENIRKEIKKAEEERDNIRRNPDFKKDDKKEKKEKKEKKANKKKENKAEAK